MILSTIVFFLQNDILGIKRVHIAFAVPVGPPTAIQNPLIYGSIADLLDHLLNVLLVFSGAAITVLIVYAGLLYILSGANPKTRKKATDTLKYAIIGFMIIAAARLIVSVVGSFIP